MIYIDLENNPPKKEWIYRADAVTAKLIAEPDPIKRDKLIDKNANLWGELKEYLASLSYEKCWYTESKNAGAYCHVDHFRPKKEAIAEDGVDKGGYWWLSFEWMNYRYSGPAANVKKNAYFHVVAEKATKYGDNIKKEQTLLLYPIQFTDPDHLSFDNEGMAKPKSPDKKSLSYQRADYSIKRLNLNFPKIVDTRKDFYRLASNKIILIENYLKLEEVNPDDERQREISQLMKELWEMCSRKAEYSAAIKFCLKSTGHDWALEIIAKAA